MEVYSNDIQVKETDLDQLNHVNNVRYVQWVQDIAEAHWLAKAGPEIRETYFWVLIDHHIQYKAEAKFGDTIAVETYVKTSQGLISNRIVNMYLKHNNTHIVSSSTKWCLMDKASKKPIRIPPNLSELFK